MSNILSKLKSEINKLKNHKKAKAYAWYFKTGPGQYGAGDIFWGLTMGQQRSVAKKYINLSLADIQELLKSKIHEHRMIALLILVKKYGKAAFVIPAKA